uniref:Uncharacterized protein n=1 Tax=Oryza glaberrima TaxID=4538 RepID=I1QZK7_ORYGL
MAGVGGRLGTATARVVRRTMTRLKDGGAPLDYEEAYPVLYLGGGGACWRKGLVRDSPRQRLDGCGLAVAPSSADAGRDDGAGIPGESEGFGLRLWVWRLRVVWRVSWREGSIYRRGRSERQARGIVAKCLASLACAGGGRRGTRLAAGVGFAHGLQRGCKVSQREPGAVGLALSLRASALAGGGGVGLATAAAVVGAWARQGIGRDGVGFVRPWHSGIRGQRVAQGRVGSLLRQRERGRARERQLRVGRAGEGRGEGSCRASGRGAPALPQLCQRKTRAEVAWSAWKP